MPTAAVSDSDIRTALDAAEKLARRLAPTQALAELAQDKATDAILRALRSYDSRRGPFPTYARSFTWLAITAALRKPLPRSARRLTDGTSNTPPETACRERPADPNSAYEKLPPPLRTAAILRFCHGYSATDAAILCGINRTALRARLLEAALLIEP
ncbi:MAG: hypothetical protein KF873_02055 [Gemmataceae bacterium]|nr:hypothetical protein [Gemmataceae bacterium]